MKQWRGHQLYPRHFSFSVIFGKTFIIGTQCDTFWLIKRLPHAFLSVHMILLQNCFCFFRKCGSKETANCMN